MSKQKLLHIGCPSCGGIMSCDISQQLTQCLHCESQVLIDDADICPQYYLKPLFDKIKATEATATQLSNPRVDRTFLRNFTNASTVRLVYLPIFSLRGIYLTAVPGKKYAPLLGVKPDKHTEAVSMRVTNYYELAISAKEFGLSSMEVSTFMQSLNEEIVKPYNREAMGLEAQVFAPDKRISQLKAIFDSSKSPDNQKEWASKNNKLISKLVQPAPALYYCPFYIFSTSHNNSLYKTVVNGATGNIIFGRAPESSLTNSMTTQSLIFLLAIGTLLLSIALQKTGATGQFPALTKLTMGAFGLFALQMIFRLWERLWFGRYVECRNSVFFKKELYKRKGSIAGSVIDLYEEGLFFLVSRLYGAPLIRFGESDDFEENVHFGENVHFEEDIQFKEGE